MPHQKRFQPVAHVSAFAGKIHQPLVEDDADADISAFERNPPAPPPVADDVVGGGVAGAVSGF